MLIVVYLTINIRYIYKRDYPMKMQEFINDILDLIDRVSEPEHPESQVTTIVVGHPTATIDQPGDASPLSHAGTDINRWRQIVDLADNDGCEPYGNSPKEMYADIDSVTKNAGGGVNGPKHPADIRGEHPSMYPAYQAGFGE
jgi:hypothetical protein